MQTRALMTYIKRIYFPFILRDPHLYNPVPGSRCALWAYAEPAVAGTTAAQECMGTALLIASLAELPGALGAVSQAVADSGAPIRMRVIGADLLCSVRSRYGSKGLGSRV